MPSPTLRTLARQLGLSRTTVSDALRGSPRVKRDTVERVRAAAKAAGYDRNPLTGAVMSYLRRSSADRFRGVLAVMEIVAPDHSEHSRRYAAAVLTGVNEKAAQLGFKVETFQIGTGALKLNRLDSILRARSINGLIVLPASGFPDLSEIDWGRYAAVYVDYFIGSPAIHCVCLDHYRSMVELLHTLHQRGYRRPGLFMERAIDDRLHFRWEGAFLALQQALPDFGAVPVLRSAKLNDEEFATWFRAYEPDVVLGHFPEAIAWMKQCGADLSGRHGFVCLNSLRTSPGECASLDFQAPQLGARATELVTGHLLHSEFGIPAQPSLTTIPARLIEGPTLRAPGDPVPAPAETVAAAKRKRARS